MKHEFQKPHALHRHLKHFPQCSMLCFNAHVTQPPVYHQSGETHCSSGLGAVTQSSSVIPQSSAAVPNDIPPSGCLMKTKALFENSPPVWKELRPCVSECVKEAGRWCRDDTGLSAEEQRVVVRRMNSDWRSAQWQLNDLRSVNSVSINQTALSRLPPFIPPPSLSLWL